MPAFVFHRRRNIELEAGFVLAGQLVVDIRKGEKLKPRHEQLIGSIIQYLCQWAQSGEMPEDAIIYGWPNGKRPPDADQTIDDDALMAAWAKDRMIIAVRVDSRDPDEGLRLDSEIMRQMGLAPDGSAIN